MMRNASENAILLIEGPSDEKLLWHFLDHDKCWTVIAWGKCNATGAMRIVRERGCIGVLCIIDRDYSMFVEDPCHLEDDDIIAAEEHDMEIMLFKSRAFDRVLVELGSRKKINQVVESGSSPIEIVMKLAYSIGLLRLYGLRKGVPLTFDEIRYRFIDHKRMVIDTTQMIEEIFRKSSVSFDVAEVSEYLDHLSRHYDDRWRICCGHDASEIACRSLRKLFGSLSSTAILAAEFESRLRLAFGDSEFLLCSVFRKIVSWECNNRCYRVLSSRLPRPDVRLASSL